MTTSDILWRLLLRYCDGATLLADSVFYNLYCSVTSYRNHNDLGINHHEYFPLYPLFRLEDSSLYHFYMLEAGGGGLSTSV